MFWASVEETMQKVEVKKNWIRVRVTGLRKAFKIDFEDVFVSAEVVYQIMQSI